MFDILLEVQMVIQMLSKKCRNGREPDRVILCVHTKSNDASIECIERGLNPLLKTRCVMGRAEN